MSFDPRLIDLSDSKNFWPVISSRFQISEIWLQGLHWTEPEDADLYRLKLELKGSRSGEEGDSLFQLKQDFGFAELIPTTNILQFVQALRYLGMSLPIALLNSLQGMRLTEEQRNQIKEWNNHNNLREVLKQGIASRSFTPKFLRAWEQYQTAITTLEFYINWIAPAEYEVAHYQETLEGLKAWSSLVRDDIAKNSPVPLLQKQVDVPFAKFLQSIIAGDLNPPSYINAQWMRAWVQKAFKLNNKGMQTLRKTYTWEKVSVSEQRINALATIKLYLPPARISEYT